MERNGNQMEEVPAPTSSDELEVQQVGAGRIHYNRHTPEQVQELEKLFKEKHHPNEKDRMELAKKLNIDVKKVKFWFQNRRTQQKAREERHQISSLRKKNEKLQLENLALKEEMKTLLCSKCGGNPLCSKCGGEATFPDRSVQDRKHLMEIARLQNELNRVTNMANQFLGKPSSSLATPLPKKMITHSDTATEELAGGSSHNFYGTPNPIIESRSQMGFDIPIQGNVYLEKASGAMEEILKLKIANTPLWHQNMEGGGEILNFQEYARYFSPCLGPKPLGFLSEATKASGVVSMMSSDLVEALLNANQWGAMFLGIIGSCTTMEVISNGTGGSRNGALQLMKAEFQLISPIVPVRVMNFIRLAKQQGEGVWVVADLSIVGGVGGQTTRRCPSGCIIQDMENGFSTVTWIEHTEYDEELVPQQYRHLIRSGAGFGAQRWISALLRHCEGIRSTMSPNLNRHLVLGTRRSLKSLAHRMKSIFCDAVCLTDGQQWDIVVDVSGRPRIMARKCPPFGIVASASYSVWIAANHRHLFDLLLTNDLRCVWDVMCYKIATGNLVRFPLDQDEHSLNCISILSSNTPSQDNQVMVVQETASDMTGSLIVYATVDIPTVTVVMNGEDTSSVALLPSGLSIVPGYGEADGERGSMVTLGFQILQDPTNETQTLETISTLNDLVFKTIKRINKIVRSSRQ